MKTLVTLFVTALFALGAHAQIGNSYWERDQFRGVPSTFTNAQSSAVDQSTYKPILLNAKTTAPISFILSSTGAGTNVEGRFTITFGSSIDGVNYFTNGTWVSTFGTNGVTKKTTNWVHGAAWPYLHILSATIVSNTATAVKLEHVQPRY